MTSAIERAVYTAALADVALFRGLETKDLERVAEVATPMEFAAGEVVVAEGEEDGRFYLILDGRARVDVGGEFREHLDAGGFFGEMSVIDGEPRAASVTAETDLRTLSLARWHLRPLFDTYPSITYAALVEMCRRLRLGRPTPPTS